MSTNSTKQQQVYESVKRRIEAGDFLPGDRIPSDSEFVREFGVSRPTVAKALRELERCGIVQRKTGSGTYVLDVQGTGGQQFGLLIPGLGETEIFEPICASMARTAQSMGHGLVWGANAMHASSNDKGRQALELCEKYILDGVGGVFFAPLEHVEDKDSVNAKIVQVCDEARIPVVLLDRDYVPYPGRSSHDLVGIDNRRVGYTVTHHLFQHKCKKVMFFARPGSAVTIDARIAGFIEAAVKDAGSFDGNLVQRCDPQDKEAVGKFFSVLRPDGIVCGNDVTAGHLMHTLDQLGIDVPEDVLVAGIDDVKYAELLRVPLTTVRQPCEAIGEAAFRTMINRIESPDSPAKDILLDCDLIQRESTFENLPKGTNNKVGERRGGTWYNDYTWASYILPYLEQGNASDQFDFAKAISHADHFDARNTYIDLYDCPSDESHAYNQPENNNWNRYYYSYVANFGNTGCGQPEEVTFSVDDTVKFGEAPFTFGKSIRLSKIVDGTSHTLLFSETIKSKSPISASGNGWFGSIGDVMIGRGAHSFTGLWPPNSTIKDRIEGDCPQGFGIVCESEGYHGIVNVATQEDYPEFINRSARSVHPGGVNASRLDGSVGFFSDDIDKLAWRALSSAAGGEVHVNN